MKDFLSWYMWFNKEYNTRNKLDMSKTEYKKLKEKLQIISDAAFIFESQAKIDDYIIKTVFKGYFDCNYLKK